MCTKETSDTVQNLLINPTKIKTVLCTFAVSASCHLSTNTNAALWMLYDMAAWIFCWNYSRDDIKGNISDSWNCAMNWAESTGYDHANIIVIFIIINSMTSYNVCMEWL